MKNLALAFLKRETLTEKAYKFSFFIILADGLLKTSVFYFIGRHLDADYFAFVFAGIVFGRFFHFFSSVFSDFLKHEQHRGAVEPLTVSPYGIRALAYAAAAAKLPRFALEITALGTAGAMLGFRPDFGNAASIVLVMLITSAAFAAAGIFFAALSLRIKRSEQAGWFFASLTEILSGVYFPSAALPGFARTISACLPTTFLLNWWRTAFGGDGISAASAAAGAAAAAAALVAAHACFGRAIAGATKRGDISVY